MSVELDIREKLAQEEKILSAQDIEKLSIFLASMESGIQESAAACYESVMPPADSDAKKAG